jgi:4-amino-4-deoxy-L-arabinose transferase-like glycosyltransferase
MFKNPLSAPFRGFLFSLHVLYNGVVLVQENVMAAAAIVNSSERQQLRAITQRRTLVIAAFVMLFVFSAGIRLLTFDRLLPFTDFSDENNMYLLGRDWLGVEHDPVVPQWLAGYPPLYVWVNMGVQRLVEAFWTRPWILPADYLYALRVLAVGVGLATTALIVWIGWQLGGGLAAWLAGFIWGLTPIIVENNNLAIPDPMVYLACAAAIGMALRAWQTQSPSWSVGSLVAAIAAIYLKYPAVYALIPWAFATLGLLIRLRRRMLPWMALQIIIAAGAAAYLIFGYGAFQLSNREANTVRESGFNLMLDLSRNWNNWQFAIYPIGIVLFGITLIGAVIAYVVARRTHQRKLNWQPFAVLVLYCIVGVMISAMFSLVNFPAGKIRHVLPITVALIPMWAAGVAQITWVLKYSRLAVTGIIVTVGALTLPNMLTGNLELVQRFSIPSVQELLWRWTDENLPNDGMILMHQESPIELTWNRNYSGYDGVKPFEWWYETQPWQTSPATLVERGMMYFAMTDGDRTRLFQPEKIDKFTNQLTLVKAFPASDAMRGPGVTFYRLLPPQFETHVVFGEQIKLVGYDVDKTTLAPGDSLTFRPYWRIVQIPTTNYSMFIHLYPKEREELITQYDGAPTNPQRLTLTWTDSKELYIGSDVTLTLPEDVSPGDYRMVVGLYDFATGARLLLPDGTTYHEITLQVSE